VAGGAGTAAAAQGQKIIEFAVADHLHQRTPDIGFDGSRSAGRIGNGDCRHVVILRFRGRRMVDGRIAASRTRRAAVAIWEVTVGEGKMLLFLKKKKQKDF
jgi:hypothetical protein